MFRHIISVVEDLNDGFKFVIGLVVVWIFFVIGYTIMSSVNHYTRHPSGLSHLQRDRLIAAQAEAIEKCDVLPVDLEQWK